MQKEKYFIIAAGGYLTKPEVEEIIVDEQEMMREEEEEFADFEDYKTYILQESIYEFEQKFATPLVLTEAQAKEIGAYLTKEN